MQGEGDRERAVALLGDALHLQREGALEEAIAVYRLSIAVCATAEAHTSLGWALAEQGRLDDAIAHCELAIQLDPGLGTPYSDVGVYLMRRGEPDRAIPWLERAKRASRDELRQSPSLMLGQIFAAKGMLVRALREFEEAVTLTPGDALAERAVALLRRRLH